MSGSEHATGWPDRAADGPAVELLQVGLALAELSSAELWMDYVTLGGDLSRPAFTAALDDDTGLDRREFDRAATALNDAFIALGLDYRIATCGG